MKNIKRKLADEDTGRSIRAFLEDSLVVDLDAGSQDDLWVIMDLADASLRLPQMLGPIGLTRDFGPIAPSFQTEAEYTAAALTELRLTEAKYDAQAYKLQMASLIDRIDAGDITCEDVATIVREALSLTPWTPEMIVAGFTPESIAPSRRTAEAIIEEAEIYGDVPLPSRLKVRAVQALEAFASVVERDAAAIYGDAREAELVACRLAWEESVREVKADVIEHIVTHLSDFTTKERAGPLNPFAVYLAEEARLTLQQIGEAYGTSRQGASNYVGNLRKAPPIEGELADKFKDYLESLVLELSTRIAAIKEAIRRIEDGDA